MLFRSFFAKMAVSLREWGGLTDSQTEAVRKGLQQALERAAGREAAKDAQRIIDLQSAHVAVVGKRADFEAVVDFSTSFETIYGTSYIYGLRDAGGNILIIKGSTPVQISKGQKVKFAAFVKAHGERDGVVPFALGERLFKLANEPKRFARFGEASHSDLDSHGALAEFRAFVADIR